MSARDDIAARLHEAAESPGMPGAEWIVYEALEYLVRNTPPYELSLETAKAMIAGDQRLIHALVERLNIQRAVGHPDPDREAGGTAEMAGVISNMEPPPIPDSVLRAHLEVIASSHVETFGHHNPWYECTHATCAAARDVRLSIGGYDE